MSNHGGTQDTLLRPPLATTRERRGGLAHVARIVLATPLIAAASVKWYSVLASSEAMSGLLSMTSVVGLIEFSIGVWLIVGVAAGRAWWATLLLYSGFLGYSSWRAISGSTSCGCLGSFEAPPIVMAFLDAAMIAVLFAARPALLQRGTRMAMSRYQLVGLLAMIGAGAAVASADSGVSTDPQTVRTGAAGEGSIHEAASVIVHDLGYVAPGGSVEAEVGLPNTESGAVVIEKCDVECSCTVVRRYPTRIVAGETGRLDIEFTAPDRVTEYSKRIYVFRDGSNQPWRTVELKARIGLPIRVEPETIALPIEGSEPPSGRRVTVTNEGDKPIRLLYGKSADGRFTARVPRKALEPGGSVEVPIVSVGATAPDDEDASLLIHTDCETQPIVTVLITSRPAGTSQATTESTGSEER